MNERDKQLPETHKNNIARRSPFFILILLLMSPCARAGQPLTLVLNDTNEPPFTTALKDGFLDTIATEAFRRAGARLQLVKLPAERGLINANAGIEDGDLTRIAGLEKLYPNLVRVPEKLIDWEFVAYSKHRNIAATWSAIRKQIVGHITGWKIYEQHLQGAQQVVSTYDARQMFSLLARDRIDVALYARWMGQAYIRQLKLKDIYQLKPGLAKKEMFIYLHKRHAAIVPRLANALHSLKEEGVYQRLKREKLAVYIRKKIQ